MPLNIPLFGSLSARYTHTATEICFLPQKYAQDGKLPVYRKCVPLPFLRSTLPPRLRHTYGYTGHEIVLRF